MGQFKRNYRVEHLSSSELTAYRIKAIRLIDAILSTTQELISHIAQYPNNAFYIPERSQMRGLDAPDTVARMLMDIYYDDDQKVTESKQYPALVRCQPKAFELVNACNIARSQYSTFWSVVSSIRIPSERSNYELLSSALLKETRYARVNYHQAERQLHCIEAPQPTSLGFVMYGSANPNRVTKQYAWNLAVKSLSDDMLWRAEAALNQIPEDETLCYLRDNTARARLNVRQRIDGQPKSKQIPAVMPVFYLDEGEAIKITDSMDSKNRRAPRPPSRRESKPLIEGLALYRYLMPYRHPEQ